MRGREENKEAGAYKIAAEAQLADPLRRGQCARDGLGAGVLDLAILQVELLEATAAEEERQHLLAATAVPAEASPSPARAPAPRAAAH